MSFAADIGPILPKYLMIGVRPKSTATCKGVTPMEFAPSLATANLLLSKAA